MFAVARIQPANHIQTRGFTLIEVLVVVAIMALLISILLPSLAMAREQARNSLCLANLNQQGLGYSAYSVDYRGTMPRVGSQFYYTIQEGAAGQGSDWLGVGAGALWGKYITKSMALLFCPSDKNNGPKNTHPFQKTFTNESLFRFHMEHAKQGDPLYHSSHNTQYFVSNDYAYALPGVGGAYPQNRGRDIYRDAMTRMVIEDKKPTLKKSNYYMYMTDPGQDNGSYLGTFPPGTRGKYNVLALSCDGYFGGLKSWHRESLNVLYSDFHAKRVADPQKKFVAGEDVSANSYTTGEITTWRANAFKAWDYMSKQN